MKAEAVLLKYFNKMIKGAIVLSIGVSVQGGRSSRQALFQASCTWSSKMQTNLLSAVCSLICINNIALTNIRKFTTKTIFFLDKKLSL